MFNGHCGIIGIIIVYHRQTRERKGGTNIRGDGIYLVIVSNILI